ncbi:MAG TPA: TonB-dependent receptor, partial [Pyrinomonadaceae bacterium]|nr:TonB-dependent receptor [Pyrinomonadaceae bacterium]
MRVSKLKTRALISRASLLLAVFAVNSAFAQAGTSGVNGSVTDQAGGSVPGATVRLVNPDTGFTRTTTTNSQGQYSFAGLQPGNYRVEVEAAGFNRAVTTPFQALVDNVTSMPIILEIGEVTVTVTVDASGIEGIVNTQDASLGNNFVSQQISQLPLEGRNVAALLSLQPAVTAGGYVAGGRSDQANITLDGIDVNNQQEGTAFTPVIRVTPDSIEEFRVTTSNPDATRGRSAGAQIALITKSGSNEWHGNLYEAHRNDYFNANDWFNNAGGNWEADDLEVINGIEALGAEKNPRPKLIRNGFGGSLGGPIVKDRLFFFYNYEGMREARGVPVTRLVPLATLGQGIMQFYDSSGVLRSIDTPTINSFTAAGDVPVVDVNPNVVALLAGAAARYPANSTLAGDGINTGGYRFNASVPTRLNTHSAKFDWSITRDQKHSVSLRGNYQNDHFGIAQFFPDTPATTQWSHPIGLGVNYTWLINSSLTNRFSYGLTRLAFSNEGEIQENAITFRDIYQSNSYARAFSRVNPTHNFANDMTWIKGNHTVQFGTNIRLIRNKRVNWGAAFDTAVANFGFYSGGGSSVTAIVNRYTQATWGTNVDDAWIRSAQSSLVALLGRLNQYTARQNYDIDGNRISGTPTEREFATEEYDFYVQDSWKVRPSLTLTLGLRYGYSTPVYETSGFEAAPNIALDEYFQRRLNAARQGGNYDEPILIERSGKKNNAPPMYNADKDNFQPRIAVAWSPNFQSGLGAFIFGKNREGVLRGGFAV